MMQRYPDIEIYLAKARLDDLNAWLATILDAPPLTPAGKDKWKTEGRCQGERIPVLLVEQIADGFSSLWFDSGDSPWITDQDCAQQAAERLGVEVRCSLGGWHPGDDPDRFWQVFPDGREGPVEWPDSGR
ncbi:hypothetical protein R5M92_10065 [Halomonas sp. Bachu 37]|uniref:hypothetical protein n=1 Tax=Halomonas kashgarensis TaxID=3084920 RepID=UPI003216ED5F